MLRWNFRKANIIKEFGILTGFVDEKKSMSFPMVNGTLMETAEDTRRSPTAMSKGLRSGLARATILLNDDFPCASFLNAWESLNQIEGLGFDSGWEPEVVSDSGGSGGVLGAGEVEYNLETRS